MKKLCAFLTFLLILIIVSCEIGLGSAVDVAVPTSGISYPPKNAIVRETFVVAGECNDDMGISSVKVTVYDTENKITYGPYQADLGEGAKNWRVSLNQKDPSRSTSLFDSYKQWEFPDGKYIVSAVAYDLQKKASAAATLSIEIDNTAPVLIVSKPLATGVETATIYGSSLKLSGDIADDHEISKLILSYKKCADGTDVFPENAEVETIEITDSAELTAMSSNNPLVIAKYYKNKDDENRNSDQFSRYVKLYGDNENGPDKYYYSGFLLEDTAKVYINPGDNGSGTGNQTERYYLVGTDFKNKLAADYSLTALRLKEILKGQSEDYSAKEIEDIIEILSIPSVPNKPGNYVLSSQISEVGSSKFSLNPHNNPTWVLDEYGVPEKSADSIEFKSYTAGSSLILTLKAGRDASYPDPKSVTLALVDLGEEDSPVTDKEIIPLIGKKIVDENGNVVREAGLIAEEWTESADDSTKTYTFTLNTEDYPLTSGHLYQVEVTGTDRNGTELEPEDGRYVFRLSTSNTAPRITITEPLDDLTYGTELNSNGLTIKGLIVTDNVSLKDVANGGITVSKIVISDLANGEPVTSVSLNDFDITAKKENGDKRYKYLFEISMKPKAGKSFIPADESKYFYTLTIQAEDTGDLTGEKTLKFYIDNKKPDVTVNSVTPVVMDGNTEFVNGTLKIIGSASDSGNTGSGLKSISYEIKEKESGTVAKEGSLTTTESWNFELVTKDLDDNKEYIIEVKAVDTVDNENIAERVLKLNQTTDTPTLALSNADGSITSVDGLGVNKNMFGTVSNNKLYGLVKDDDGLSSVTVSCLKMGASARTTLAPATAVTKGSKEYSFEYTLPSTQGQYQIFVDAKDIYADGSQDLRQTDKDTLNTSFYITVDDGAPVFESVKPALQESVYYLGSKDGAPKTLTITGTISDGNGIPEVVEGSAAGLESTHYVKKADGSFEESNATTSNITGLGTSAELRKNFSDVITLANVSGTYKVIYSAKDIYGQESKYETEYSVDVEEPAVKSVSIGGVSVAGDSVTNWLTENNILVETIVKDEYSGISEVLYSVDDGETYKPMTHSVSEDSEEGEKWSSYVIFVDGKEKTFLIKVKDSVGNEKDRTITVNVDKSKTKLEAKWYKIANYNDGILNQGTLLTPIGTAYVNAKDLVLFGNYSGGIYGSGVTELNLKIGENEVTPKEITYYKKAFTVENAIDSVLADENKIAYSEENANQIKSFIAVINHEDFADGELIISGSDRTGNVNSLVTKTVMKLRNDNVAPNISGINLTKAYKAKDGRYYIRNNTDGFLTISGTSTDNCGIDKTVLKVTGQGSLIYTAESASTSWNFNKVDLCNWTANSDPSIADATVTITTLDKAGNEKSVSDILLVFDETAPVMLIGSKGKDSEGHYIEIPQEISEDMNYPHIASDISDWDDTSNPYESDYTLRGKTAWKYAGIKIGNGKYSETSYGKETSLQLTVTFIGENDGSGIAKMEYKMLSASNAQDYVTAVTGRYTGELPSSWNASGEFAVEESSYTHYGVAGEYPCYVGSATINGFERTTTGIPNLVFVRATDNCDNSGDWFVLQVQMDNENPEIKSDSTNPEALLTNGKTNLQALTGTFKDGLYGSGIKAARVYVDGTLAFEVNSSDNVEKGYVENVPKSITNDYGTFLVTGYGPTEAQFAMANPAEGAAIYSFKNAASYATWRLTLTPQNGTNDQGTGWFDKLKSKSNPQVSVEVEDWAEDASGSGNKTSLIITSLDIDTEDPSASISSPNPADILNGKQTIKGTVEENRTPKSLEIYYSNADTVPVSKDGWTTLLRKITTESAPAGSSSDTVTKYGATVQEIYSFEFKDIDFNDLIGKDTEGNPNESGTVHLMVFAEDKAGNTNVSPDDVSSACYTFNVDSNSDRPIITVLTIELVDDENSNPLSPDNYLLLNTNTLNLTITDDDGVAEAKYRIKKTAADDPKNETWKDMKLTSSGASVKFTNEGKQILEFYIKDNAGAEFSSDGINAPGLIPDSEEAGTRKIRKIYLTDLEVDENDNPLHKYGTDEAGYTNPTVYANVDTKAPVLKITALQRLDKDKKAEEDEDGNAIWWIKDQFTNVIVGGPAAQYLKVRAEATDEGSGIDESKLYISAKIKDTEIEFNKNSGTSEKVSSDEVDGKDYYYDFVIPCILPEGEDAIEKVNYIATITVSDNAGKQKSEGITIKFDNKAPKIVIKSPSSIEKLSGAVAAQGEIENKESAVFYYAISPIEAFPDGYTTATEFSYDMYSGPTETPVLGNTTFLDSSENTEALYTLCGYNLMYEDGSKSNSFYLNFDGNINNTTGSHSYTLNDWIKKMRITDDIALSSPEFSNVYKLYLHIKAIDDAGNISKRAYPILLDPLGKRPKVFISYPTKDGLTLGGAPSIMGTVTGTGVQDVWLQIDCTGDGHWTVEDLNILTTLKDDDNKQIYAIANIQNKKSVTDTLPETTTETEVAKYAIRIPTSISSWSQQINIKKELEPEAENVSTKNVKIWAYATDSQGFTSSRVERSFIIDKDKPVIDQDIWLVQWNTDDNFNGGNGFVTDAENNILLDENGKIQFKEGAVAVSRPYNENENIKQKWFIIGKVTDGSGIGTIKYQLDKGQTEYAITPNSNSDGDYSKPDQGVYIRKIEGHNYIFCLPIGNTDDEVGESSVYFYAEEINDTTTPKNVDPTFKVRYDNKKPVIKANEKLIDVEDIENEDTVIEIANVNSAYMFSGIATEDDVRGIQQTGVKRIAFYFTRDIHSQPKTIFDPMIRSKKNGAAVEGNAINYETENLIVEDNLYWKASTCNISGSTLTLSSKLINVHKGGLVKVYGTIYRIEGLSTDGKQITLSERPGDGSSVEVKFAIANIVDNFTREGEGSTYIKDEEYGYGYYSDAAFDDEDLMIESIIPKGTQYIWEATINSKNISDGPVILNYVVFDEADNVSDLQTVKCFVKNNAPRIAGVTLGTDKNGNDKIDDDEYITSYSSMHLSDDKKTKSETLNIPSIPDNDEPFSVFTIKGYTVIKPEIIGGNGDIGYKYSVAKYISTNKKWDSPYKSFYQDTLKFFAKGQEAEDSVIQTEIPGSNPKEYTVPSIEFTVKDILNSGIDDFATQKFSFEFLDETPTWDKETGEVDYIQQSATLNIVMGLKLRDTEPAENVIIPFYWESKDKNSLEALDKGHVELPKDWKLSSGYEEPGEGEPNTEYDADPKVSGAFKLEGIARDNSLLTALKLKITKSDGTWILFDEIDVIDEDGNPTGEKEKVAKTIATYTNGIWTANNEKVSDDSIEYKWKVEIKPATYGEYKAAYGISDTDIAADLNEAEMPELSQDYGHVVHWIMHIDTEKMEGMGPAAGITITASADDKGNPGVVGSNIEYTPNTPVDSDDYVIDVVPYIRGIKTFLSTKSKKSDSSEYDRTALGHYPVASTEQIYIYGFNLAGGKLYDKDGTELAYSEPVTTKGEDDFDKIANAYKEKGLNVYKTSAVTTFKTGEITVKVGDIESLNNKNNNDAKGSYTGIGSDYSSYCNFYNRKPNEANNYLLTDDIILDVWYFNSSAALPNPGGRLDEPIMKINPASKIIGTAFLSGTKRVSIPQGNTNSYKDGGTTGVNQQDFRSTVTLAYDYRGWSYYTEAGGNEGDRVKFGAYGADGKSKLSINFEYINQLKMRDGSGTYMDLRYKVRSPSIATSPALNSSNANDTNIYMVYYDSYNDEIRYKYGTVSDTGLIQKRRTDTPDANEWNNNNPYSCKYAQVIATDATTNLPRLVEKDEEGNPKKDEAGNLIFTDEIDPSYAYTGTPLGGAGEFVDIDVIPCATVGSDGKVSVPAGGKDVVVVVWYDAKAKALKYSYNTDPTDYSWADDNDETNDGKNVDYRGLNSQNWQDAQTIFTNAGEFCQVKVDKNGGVHIAAYDINLKDLRYAYLNTYNATPVTYTVDSSGNVGSFMRMDVALDSAGNPMPYISYWGGNMPKIAYPKTTNTSNGASGDMFTGDWEISYIPTGSTLSDLEQKRIGNYDNRINVAVWKDADGKITDSKKTDGTIGSSSPEPGSGICWGNGTANPVVGYSITDNGNDTLETAQMQ